MCGSAVLGQFLRIFTLACQRQTSQSDLSIPSTADHMTITAVGHEFGLNKKNMQNGKDTGIVWFGLIHYSAFFSSEGHVALDRNPGPGYDTLLLRMIPGDLLSACPHRQFHTLPGLLDSRAALPNSNPNACVPMQGGSLYHFYDGLWYDPTGRRTHDLPCERRTR